MTTRRVVLVRHAKAAAGEDDHERPLTDRGVRDATEVGRWLALSGMQADRVVSSTARRARQTWDHAATVLDWAPEILDEHRMYDNTVDALLAIIHETPPEVGTLVLVGHNPSIGELAAALDDGTGDADSRDALARSYPTSGVSSFDVPTEWAGLEPGGAAVTSFVVLRG
jgi:phosphohistidine phosphatase